MATRNIVPRATGEGSIGTSAKTWGAGYFDNLAVNEMGSVTMTGDIVANQSAFFLRSNADTNAVCMAGGSDSTKGAFLNLWGKDHDTYPGWFSLHAKDATNDSYLVGKPNGTLTWKGKNIPTKDVNVQAGSKGSISVPANSNTTTTISFTTGFASTPIVVATPATGYVGMSAQVSSITTSGCTITINNASSTARTITCNWVAISL